MSERARTPRARGRGPRGAGRAAGAEDTATRARKRDLRWERWLALREAGAARFPGAIGRIPNFTGAEAAAERLAGERAWKRARVVGCNPDLAQRPVRARALREGKVVCVTTPRLEGAPPFLRLDPERLEPEDLWRASSIQGSLELGEPAAPEDLPPLGLVVIGSVAAARDGARLGKGGGFADLEYALLLEAGKVHARTPVATTVHAGQVVRAGTIPMAAHDLPVDLVVTPERVLRCPRAHRRPRGLLWEALDAERLSAIPLLAARAPEGTSP